jgi:hypothetical protein
VARGRSCLLFKLKERWIEAALPIQVDKNLISKMKVVYKKYTDAMKSIRRMNGEKKQELVNRWDAVTVDLSVRDWEAAIHADLCLSAQDKEEKIALMLDYLGDNATR